MWIVETTEVFNEWFHQQSIAVQKKILSHISLLQHYGHQLARPYADTVYGSKFNHMKELRIQAGGDPYRAFYAFDPTRKAIILCAGNKANDKQFYHQMIELADRLYEQYLQELEI
ncbi:MAG: type II toxin-antitoxin system RelE/ParE family toxin [Acinetobacter sp.]|nr:type II toxin-antitoxin system RelE/ParE family toxin [Acinetobacter sp.]